MGIIIGILAFGLAGVLIYMRRQQKVTGEILRNSEVSSQAQYSSCVAPTTGISEAEYPNIQGAVFVTRNQTVYGQLGMEPESSVSPPSNRATVTQPVMTPRDPYVSHGQQIQGVMPMASRINSPQSPSLMYAERHGIVNGRRLRLVFPIQ